MCESFAQKSVRHPAAEHISSGLVVLAFRVRSCTPHTSFVVVCTSAGAKREPLNLVGCHWLVLSTRQKLSPSDRLECMKQLSLRRKSSLGKEQTESRSLWWRSGCANHTKKPLLHRIDDQHRRISLFELSDLCLWLFWWKHQLETAPR
jgi:hypothetical protein